MNVLTCYGRKVNPKSLQIELHPDPFFFSGEDIEGLELSGNELDSLSDNYPELLFEMVQSARQG